MALFVILAVLASLVLSGIAHHKDQYMKHASWFFLILAVLTMVLGQALAGFLSAIVAGIWYLEYRLQKRM